MKTNLDISQITITKKIVSYLSLQSDNKVISQERIHQINRGLCYGFSIVHSYMAAKGMALWWESILILVSQWDEKITSLNTQVEMPVGTIIPNTNDLNEKSTKVGQVKSTYKDLLNRVSNYVLLNQSSTNASGISNINQNEFLKLGGTFASVDGPIQFYQVFAGHFNVQGLHRLFEEMINEQPIEALILIASYSHSCSLRYDEDKVWHLYDPYC